MESEKENLQRVVNKTRIPLPRRPTRPIPVHLIEKECVKDISKRRAPLGELNNGNLISNVSKQIKVAQNTHAHVSSSTIHPQKTPSSLKFFNVDMRNITHRNRNEEQLDWKYQVFSDVQENHNVAFVASASEESYLSESNNNTVDRMRVSPPANNSDFLNKTIKNLKRSLKRPHSRELQGLSPGWGQKKKDDTQVRLTLSCYSRYTSLLEPVSHLQCMYRTALTADYTEGIFAYLFEKELRSRSNPRIASVTRACVINWLIKVNSAGANRNPAVIQSACWYLDSVLSTHKVDVNNLQLVAAACYWIAMKLRGPAVTAKQMARYSANAFTVEKLLYTERSVIVKLKFPPMPIVPQDFIDYLALWCDYANPREIEDTATFLCLAGMLVDKSLCIELPSVIAAACVRNALLLLNKEEMLFHLSMCPIFTKAQKEVADTKSIDAILYKAIKTVSSPDYKYNSIVTYFENLPLLVTEKMITEPRKNILSNVTYRRKSSH